MTTSGVLLLSTYLSKGNKDSKETPRRISYEANDSNNSYVYQGMK